MRPRQLGKRLAAAGRQFWWNALLLSLAVGAVFHALMANSIESEARERFRSQARYTQHGIGAVLKAYTEVLRGTASYLQSSGRVDPESFRRYVQGLDLEHHFPAIDTINFAEYIRHEERAALEQRMQALVGEREKYPPFSIKPAGRRKDYTVITLIDPLPSFSDRYGLDLAARPAGAAALNQARDSGQIFSSGRPVSVPGSTYQVGMPLRMPIYRKGMPLTTVAERRAAYIGSVGIGFNMQRLVQAALNETPTRDMRVTLYGSPDSDTPEGQTGALLFDSANERAAQREEPSGFMLLLPIEFNGRNWQARFSAPKRALYSRFDAYMPWFTGLMGFIGSMLMYALFHALSSARKRAVRMARAMTRELRDSQVRLQLSHQRLRRLAAHAEQIKEEERKRIAREIHDDLGQNLLALRIEADILANRTAQRHPRLHERARATLKQIDETIRSVRTIINDLRPTVLDLGLHAAVEWQIAQFRQRSGIACELIEQGGDTGIDDRCAVAFFRVLQESLSNIQQHARASLVRVELTHHQGMLRMAITDNGIGLQDGNRNKTGSFGLVGMEERMNLLGGQCVIAGSSRGGTTVTVSVAVSHKAPPALIGEFAVK
ncbi:CHASE domain-containing protein [Massilia endophytica]|uniref:CHASE domain-containing protein n=1 Tax=Massilia endophytica TaxID=2899220 RepID=UPI001E451E0D|nr:CHASE domain-containing protein [Massilia endophytica]UGQ47460.1 CHASE domain-containing protein [Massilia endophytica]